MKKLFKNFAQDESGATAIEYGLIAAGISVAIIAIAGLIGDQLVITFNAILAGLTAANT